ncbi:MAG: penicillin-binding transpeptidase domain-containing protein [Polyangiaceae bacterium]|nr:penicillin-binding transpeptidase domain-containing protein [Polyangiaceae bacterium]
MKRWVGLALAGATLCVAPLVWRRAENPLFPGAPGAPAEPSDELAKVQTSDGSFAKNVSPPPLAGIDLRRLKLEGESITSPAHGGRIAHLTLDPALQRQADRLLRGYEVPEIAVVMADMKGRVLVWSSRRERGQGGDLCADASAPAASVFKIATAAALVERAGLGPDTRQCYWGGDHRIEAAHLADDPRKDRSCVSLASAMGRSTNAVFARLASKHLSPESLEATARSLGFGDAPAFDVPVEPNGLNVPEEPLGFARTSAGFWNTTLSPLGAVSLALTVANHGMAARPYIVERVTEGPQLLFRAPARYPARRAIKPETADALTRMLETAVSEGTCYRAFHDAKGRAFLPNINVAGKTGTLTRGETDQFYTWFVGFAPARAPEVAISVLAINGSSWRVKANVVARDMLRSYFASRGAPGVTMPR